MERQSISHALVVPGRADGYERVEEEETAGRREVGKARYPAR